VVTSVNTIVKKRSVAIDAAPLTILLPSVMSAKIIELTRLKALLPILEYFASIKISSLSLSSYTA